jgi:hypothetical protein
MRTDIDFILICDEIYGIIYTKRKYKKVHECDPGTALNEM